jgi:hypothetical protein
MLNVKIMLTERDLLFDIIQNTPENSVWNISSDSWERIPEVFAQFIAINETYGWDIVIRNDNREQILEIIDKEEIYDKIIHQNIILGSITIFESYDRMIISFLEKSFPCFEYIIQKYRQLEFEVLELCLS